MSSTVDRAIRAGSMEPPLWRRSRLAILAAMMLTLAACVAPPPQSWESLPPPEPPVDVQRALEELTRDAVAPAFLSSKRLYGPGTRRLTTAVTRQPDSGLARRIHTLGTQSGSIHTTVASHHAILGLRGMLPISYRRWGSGGAGFQPVSPNGSPEAHVVELRKLHGTLFPIQVGNTIAVELVWSDGARQTVTIAVTQQIVEKDGLDQSAQAIPGTSHQVMASSPTWKHRLYFRYFDALGFAIESTAEQFTTVQWDKGTALANAGSLPTSAVLMPGMERVRPGDYRPPAGRTPSSTPGKRVAMVVGNGAYLRTRALPNPRRDAEAIATRLRTLDFEVELVTDSSADEMKSALRRFRRSLRGARIALFYYAGHAVQVEGANYLLPVDAELRTEGDLHYDTIPLDLVMTELESSDAVRIIVLDACRDNPFLQTLATSLPATRSAGLSRGLAISRRSTVGTLIAFATAPNQVAADGDGSHSPYTEALLEWIGTPGLEIGEVFRKVRADVISASGGRQIPWENSSLIGEGIYLGGTR